MKRDFLKLLNNSNFGIDCRNNIDNCILEPLYDDLNDISYIKKFITIFSDDTFRNFFSPVHLRKEINQTLQSKVFALNKEDPTCEARKKYFENKMDEELDAVDSFDKNKNRRERQFQKIDEKTADCFDPRKTKMIVEFNGGESASTKSFAVKKRSEIKITTCFMSGKLLMFAKLSLSLSLSLSQEFYLRNF